MNPTPLRPQRACRALGLAVFSCLAAPAADAAVNRGPGAFALGSLTGALAVAAGTYGWWRWWRVRRAPAAVVLAQAECLLWEATVAVSGDHWTWRFRVQRSGLSERLVGKDLTLHEQGLWYPFNIPEQAEMDRRARAALLAGEPGYEQEFYILKDGGVIWLRESVSIKPLGAGRFSLVGVATDITEQREAVRARIASEERLRQLLDHADCLLWQARVTRDAAGEFHWEWFVPRSELYRRIVGEDPAIQPRMPWNIGIVPEFAELEARSRHAMSEGLPGYEQEFRVVLGSVVLWLHEQVTVARRGENEWALDGVVIDVSEQRLAQEAKNVSEAQLRQVVETADFLLWHARVFQAADGTLRWALTVPPSNLYRRLFDREPEPRWPVLPWDMLVDAEKRVRMKIAADNAIAGGAPGYEQEIFVRKDGRALWLHEQATIRPIGLGEWQVVGMVTDVSARREAEEARRASEETLRDILERADCLLWRARVTRADDGSLRWGAFDLPRSRLSLDLFGDRPGLIAEQMWNLIEVPELPAMDAHSVAAIVGDQSGYEQEFCAMRDRRVFWLHERVSIRAEGPDVWQLVGLITDVSDRHAAEEARRSIEARLEQLLERADCTIWQGRVVWREGGDYDWSIYVPRSRLFRRIFGCDPHERNVFDWAQMGVPELDAMMNCCNRALRDGEPGYQQTFHVPKPEGDIWLAEQVSISPAGPDRWDLVGVITDVTARHEADEARAASEAQLQQIMERADCMIWQAVATERPDGAFDWNLYTPRSVLYRRLFGDDASPQLNWNQLDIPEAGEMARRAAEALRSGAAGYEQEFRSVYPRRVIWLREVVTIAPFGSGRKRLVGVITDITAQREAQEAKRASEAQVDQILATADCLLWQARVFAPASGALHWVMFVPRSRLYRAVFGADPPDPPTLDWPAVLDPETDAEINRRAQEAIFAGRSGYEQEFRVQRAGRVFWLHETVSISPAGPGEWRLVGVITDLTARRQADQAVAESERRFRTLFQHTPVAVVEADFTAIGAWLDDVRRSGVADLAAWLDAGPASIVEAAKRVRILDCNDTAMAMLRARSKSDFRRRRGRLATPDGLRAIREALLALWSGRNTMETQIEMRDFEGRPHFMNVRWWTGVGDHGLELAQTVMVFVDLTELKRAEAALAAEKERLAVTLRAMAEGVVTTDVDGAVQFMNPAAAELTRWTAETAIGRPVAEICRLEAERDGVTVEVPVRRVAQGDVVVDLPLQTRLVARDGGWRLVQGCCAPIHSTESRVIGAVFVFRDVTEQERLEQELVRATRLESVGILAGGIAHDFNNILTAVMGNLALALLDVEPDSEVALSLRSAEKASLRARDLTQQLLTFAKGGEPVRAAVLLDVVVREMTAFSLHGSRVKAVFDLPADLWPADADKGQIGRVVQNLTLNAVQAMPEGGTLRITARNETVAALARPPLAAGHYLRIEIADTGVGIRPEHLARIFDPYFTTKQAGSGLGLAAAYSIVRKHQGHIAVESEPGRGTTFRIWLPASQAEPAVGAVAAPGAAAPLQGRVLFMDDEEIIRSMASALLRRCGLEVVTAVDGAEAVEKFRAARAEGRPFALVIMDLTVPGGIGGKEAIALLREIDPQVRAIVSSGYSSDPVLANHRAYGFRGVVAKPYEYADFVRVLHDVLAE